MRLGAERLCLTVAATTALRFVQATYPTTANLLFASMKRRNALLGPGRRAPGRRRHAIFFLLDNPVYRVLIFRFERDMLSWQPPGKRQVFHS